MLSELVRARLAQLLADNGPRRARDGLPPPGGPATTVSPPWDEVPAPDADEEDAWPARLPGDPPVDPDPDPDLDPDRDPDRGGGGGSGAGEGAGPGAPPTREARSLRLPFGRAHVGVVVALLVIGLFCAGWSVLRARPVALASTPTLSQVPSGRASASATPSRSGTATPSAPPVLVHVLGAVRRPGVVTLPEHARVRDAIAAAGGLRPSAAPGDLNLAQVLVDGQQVVIGTKGHPEGEVRDGGSDGSAVDPSGTAGGGGAVVDLNRASQGQLEELPGVGPVTAGKILAWRQEHGRFSRVEELQEVDGIGPKTYAQIAPHARV